MTVAPGDSIPVRVTVTDDQPVSSVGLRWRSPAGDVTYSLAHLSGTTWGIDLDLSWSAPAGSRSIRVTASDAAGRKATGPDRTIEVTP